MYCIALCKHGVSSFASEMTRAVHKQLQEDVRRSAAPIRHESTLTPIFILNLLIKFQSPTTEVDKNLLDLTWHYITMFWGWKAL